MDLGWGTDWLMPKWVLMSLMALAWGDSLAYAEMGIDVADDFGLGGQPLWLPGGPRAALRCLRLRHPACRIGEDGASLHQLLLTPTSLLASPGLLPSPQRCGMPCSRRGCLPFYQ